MLDVPVPAPYVPVPASLFSGTREDLASMGVTIAYRGRLADLARIEDFENRLVDCALEMGGLALIWRSWPDDDPERMVRGVILDLAPGQESTSLLLSPEGWLIGLTEIQDAEDGRLKGPPWCFIKTQFGPVEGHVALIEMLAALKRGFLPDLEVSDDGGYWETHDLAELVRIRSLTRQGIDGLAEGLRRHGLSRGAAEDPSILLRRVERVAEQVHRVLRRPSENPPVEADPGDDLGSEANPEATEKLWDEIAKHDRRRQERMRRAIEERRSRGLDEESAFRSALREVVPDLPDDEAEPSDEPWRDPEDPPFAESLAVEAAGLDSGFREADDDSFETEGEEHHPLLQKAMDLLNRLDSLFHDARPRLVPALGTLYRDAGVAMGGLAQALAQGNHDPADYGLRVLQLKRAVRGAAFARGALFPLRSNLSPEEFEELFLLLQQMETEIVSELGQLRSEHRGDNG
jgi:hypothetical protein